jgi:hypothetical protein
MTQAGLCFSFQRCRGKQGRLCRLTVRLITCVRHGVRRTVGALQEGVWASSFRKLPPLPFCIGTKSAMLCSVIVFVSGDVQEV